MHLTEILLARLGIMDRHDKGHLGGIGRHQAKFDLNRLIITRTFTGPVVALVPNRARRILGVVVEHEMLIAQHLAACVQHKRRGVQIKGAAIGLAQVPAQAKPGFLNPRRLFAQ